MAVNLSPLGGAGAQFFSNNGVPLAGGLLYTYQAGTSTPATAYTSSSGSTALANPIILDAAGRVPTGEIWLVDGISYKFVLKDATDALIATWDNLVGINSNFIAYSSQVENATATAGQTVFNLSITYLVGANNLAVYVNGSKQIANVNYTETTGSSVTFLTGLNVGDVVQFATASPVSTNAMDASNVSYTPAGGTNAVTTNVQDKLRQTVSVKDFGAVGDGVTDDTTAITNAMTAATSILFPEGTYLITSNLVLTANCVFDENAIISSAYTLDFTKGVSAGLYQIFNTTAYMRIRNVPEMYPQWWGALGNYDPVADTGNDDTAAFQQCFNAVRGVQSSMGANTFITNTTEGCPRIRIVKGQYKITGSINLWNGTIVDGEVVRSIAGAFLYKDTALPMFNCYPLNYDLDGTQLNYDSGEMSWTGVGVRGGGLGDYADEAVLRFRTPAEGVAIFGGVVGPGVGGWFELMFNDFYLQNLNCPFIKVNGSAFTANLNRVVGDVMSVVMDISGTTTGKIKSTNCEFYATQAAAIVDSTATNVFDIEFDNCEFTAGAKTNGNTDLRKGINYTGYGTVTIRECVFASIDLDGTLFGGIIYVVGAANLYISNSRFYNLNGAETQFNSTQLFTDTVNNVLISDNYFEYEIPYGLNDTDSRVLWVNGNSIDPTKYVKISDNVFKAVNATYTVTDWIYSDYAVPNNAHIIDNLVYGNHTNLVSGNYRFNNNIYGNTSNQQKPQTYGSAPPAAGTWALGTILWNTNPTSGGNIGWVCTTAGTPGTWKTFGAIA